MSRSLDVLLGQSRVEAGRQLHHVGARASLPARGGRPLDVPAQLLGKLVAGALAVPLDNGHEVVAHNGGRIGAAASAHQDGQGGERDRGQAAKHAGIVATGLGRLIRPSVGRA
jgi:hypothetical protein